MKYMINKFESFGIEIVGITTTLDESSFVGFSNEIGNPNYNQFLVDAKLTDKQVKELEPDVWYDFPEGGK